MSETTHAGTLVTFTQQYDCWVRGLDEEGRVAWATCNKDGYADAAGLIQAGTADRARDLYGLDWMW